MTRGIVSTAMVFILFVFAVGFYIIQTVNGDSSSYVGDFLSGITGSGSTGDTSGGSNTGSTGDTSGGSNTDGSGGSSSYVGDFLSGITSSSSGQNSGGSNTGGSGGKDGSCDGCHDGNHNGDHCDHGCKSNCNPGGGSDNYEISAKETTCYNSKNVIINEIYHCTETCVQSGIGGIELYNTGDTPVNVSRWYFKNATGYVMAALKNEEIPPYGFLVVGVDGLTRNYQEITLVDSCSNNVCSVLYTGTGSHCSLSYSRLPDGARIWKWMNSTLGYPNMQGISL